MPLNDAHCHFFSRGSSRRSRARPADGSMTDPAIGVPAALGWEAPGTPRALANRWMTEIDAHQVQRAVLIASVPGDEAVRRRRRSRAHPAGFVGFFMVNPLAEERRRADAAALADGPARRVPVSGDAPLLAARRRASPRCRASRADAGGGGVRALRRAVGRRPRRSWGCPADSICASAIRWTCRRSPRVAARAVHHPALRRRLLPRGADGGGHVRQHPSRHLELERWIEIHPRPDARDVFRQARPGRRAGAPAVRHRLVVLPARLAAAGVRHADGGARPAEPHAPQMSISSWAGISSGCFRSEADTRSPLSVYGLHIRHRHGESGPACAQTRRGGTHDEAPGPVRCRCRLPVGRCCRRTGTAIRSMPDPAVATSSAIMLTGCIAKAPDGKGFVLTQQAGAPGSVTSPQTGSAPGTSATGDAPSGSVTAGTPTGTTATETAVPTPPVGRAGNRVNPASPTFNQGQGATGTSGTVGRVDTAGAAIASASYRLRAPKGLDLAAHVGHTVEVRGVLAPDPRARARGSSDPSAVQADNPPVLTVETLTHRAATCTR